MFVCVGLSCFLIRKQQRGSPPPSRPLLSGRSTVRRARRGGGDVSRRARRPRSKRSKRTRPLINHLRFDGMGVFFSSFFYASSNSSLLFLLLPVIFPAKCPGVAAAARRFIGRWQLKPSPLFTPGRFSTALKAKHKHADKYCGSFNFNEHSNWPAVAEIHPLRGRKTAFM